MEKSVTLTVRSVWTRVSSNDEKAHDVLHEALAYQPANFWNNPRFKAKTWDGFNRLYNTRAKVFATGLISRACEALESRGYRVSIKDERKFPALSLPDKIHLEGVTLRDNQLQAIDAALDAGIGTIKAATGFGKTEVMAGLIYALSVPTIVLVHKKELLYQTAERLKLRLGVDIGVIGDGHYFPAPVTVCTFQTAYSMLRNKVSSKEISELLKGFSLMLIDETHHATAPTFTKVTRKIPAPFRFGFSATPFKDPPGSEMELIGLTGEMITDFSLADSISEGISVKPFCFMLERKYLEVDEFLPWAEMYEEGIVKNVLRNKKIEEVCQYAEEERLPGLVIVERIDHGNLLHRATGWPFVSGQDDSGERRKAIKAVNEGKIPGIISTVMDEGIDIPNLAFICLASGGKAPHRLVQRIGRGIRKGTLDFCIIADFDDRDGEVFKRHTRSRRRTYRSLGFDLQAGDSIPSVKALLSLRERDN